jgi:tRNA-guanine family transglycosylase
MLGPVLVSVHNVRFYQRLMADLRRSIGEGSFLSFLQNDPRCSLGPSAELPVE